MIPRPAFLDSLLEPYTWITVGLILYPRHLDPREFPAIVAHERVHQRSQALACVSWLIILALVWWPLVFLAPLLGVASWLALWRFCRPFRAAAEVRGIRAELALTPAGHRARLIECYAVDLSSERYHFAFGSVEEAKKALES